MFKVGKNGIWHINYYLNGIQREESTKSTSKTFAENLLHQRIEAVRNGQIIVNRRVCFGEITMDVIRDYRIRRNKTLKDVISRTRLHLAPFFHCTVEVDPESGEVSFRGGDLAANIGNDRVQQLVLHRREQGASDGEIIQECSLLRRMLHLAVQNRKLHTSPFIQLPKEPSPRTGFIEGSQYKLLLLALPEWLRPLVALAYHSGMRRGELVSLTWDQVRLDDLRPHLRLEAGQTKNGEARVIPLTGEVLELLRIQRHLRDVQYLDCPVVFFRPARQNECKTPRWRKAGDFEKVWNEAVVAAGIRTQEQQDTKGQRLLLHDLRRSAVRNLVRAGVATSVAASISGHRTMSVFQRYNITSEEERFEAMRKVNRYINERADAQEASAQQSSQPAPVQRIN